MLGERLKIWREGIPKTLDELAAETGIPKSNLSYYETKGKNLPQEARDRLKAYGAPLTWIMTGEGSPTAKPANPGAWEGAISKEVFDAIQRAYQHLESAIRSVPPDLRDGIDIRKASFVMAQMVDDLLSGDQEKILDAVGKFLAAVPRPSQNS